MQKLSQNQYNLFMKTLAKVAACQSEKECIACHTEKFPEIDDVILRKIVTLESVKREQRQA